MSDNVLAFSGSDGKASAAPTVRPRRRNRHRARSSLATTLTETWVLTQRILKRLPRLPDIIVYNGISPAMFTLALAYVFGGAMNLPDGVSYRQFLIGGMLAQTVANAAAATAAGLALEMSDIVVHRLRTFPIARPTVIVGFTNAGVLQVFFTVLVTIGCGFAIGWRIHTGPGEVLAAMAILALFGIAMSWVGAFIGVWVSSPPAANGASTLWLFPFTYVSNAFAPVQSMPTWLQYVAELNPVSAVAAACRELFGNPRTPVVHHFWVTDHPLAMSIIWPLLILLVIVPLTLRKFEYRTSH